MDPYSDETVPEDASGPAYSQESSKYDDQGAWASEGGYYDYVPSPARTPLRATAQPFRPSSSQARQASSTIRSSSPSYSSPTVSSRRYHDDARSSPPRSSLPRLFRAGSFTPPASPSHTNRSTHYTPPSSQQSQPVRSPSPPFRPGTPSDSYLASSLIPSTRLPSPSRKLLVLDLNGTLVFRPPARGGQQRRIHPRPYMGVFAQFIAKHESIRTMVWSSAQPRNVDLMVQKAFGEHAEALIHVWARDTLGLSAEQFGRKVQTVKNLDKLWARLSPPPPEAPYSSSNTILLDDSALKAHMQPYNHLILPEYDTLTRRADMAVLGREESVEPTDIIPLSPPRKTKSKKNGPVSTSASGPDAKVDRTLLGVIGILDEVAYQDNVAGWFRSGGIWAGFKPVSGEAPSSAAETSSKVVVVESEEPVALSTGKDRVEGTDLKPEEHGGKATAKEPTATNEAATTDGKELSRLARRKRPKHKKDPEVVAIPAPAALPVPSAPPEPIQWYQDERCFEYWVKRGIEAVEKLGIVLDHGLLPASTPSQASSSSEVSEADRKVLKKSRMTASQESRE